MKALYSLLIAFMVCLSYNAVAQDQQPEKHKHEKEAKHKYECPMKCEPASDKQGKCSKCGMDLKKIKAEDAKVWYECPMKCEPASGKPGKCGKCGMDLKKKA